MFAYSMPLINTTTKENGQPLCLSNFQETPRPIIRHYNNTEFILDVYKDLKKDTLQHSWNVTKYSTSNAILPLELLKNIPF